MCYELPLASYRYNHMARMLFFNVTSMSQYGDNDLQSNSFTFICNWHSGDVKPGIITNKIIIIYHSSIVMSIDIHFITVL